MLLVELFGETATSAAISEVMATGHVGAEYVEFVMRHKKRLKPAPAPLRLGDPELDALAFREPDLAAYDELVPLRMTLDPGEPLSTGARSEGRRDLAGHPEAEVRATSSASGDIAGRA